jgi:hypothetical protein
LDRRFVWLNPSGHADVEWIAVLEMPLPIQSVDWLVEANHYVITNHFP